MLRTSLGQILVNDALPEDLRDYGRVLDKKGMNDLLRRLAQQHPDKYAEVSKKLNDIGRTVASDFGGYSFGLEHLKKSEASKAIQAKLRTQIQAILNDDSLTSKQRHDKIIRTAGAVQQQQIDDVFNEAVKKNNPLAMQVISGSRGNKVNLASLLGSDLLYSDHRDEVIPLPVYSSYSEGLKPIEYWSSMYGARRGTIATKFATADAGFLSKQLNQISHRLLVTDEDDTRDLTNRGYPVDVDDGDNEGALLAKDVGPYKRNTVLTPKMLKHIQSLGHDRILIRSPMVGGSPEGGVYARDVGVRERGVLPGRGEQVGLTAVQALSEPISQGQLSAKHSGGVSGQEKAVGGFAGINQLIQTPKRFKGGAAHTTVDGRVGNIEDAPAGGKYVWIGGERHYVGSGYELKVKKGDEVEAGDVISEGMPNPSIVVQHKGVGEGRRYFVSSFVKAMRDAGMKVNRRNVELLSRGLINHVRLTDEFQGHVPDDVVPYSTVEHLYQPRDDHAVAAPAASVGQYLETPVLHYSVGTRIRPSVVKELGRFGINSVNVHKDPPPFQPEMIRGMYSLQHDPDFMTRMYGSGLKSSLLDAVHRGGSSDEEGTSFVPGLSRAVDFGRVGLVRQPEPGKPLPPEGQALPDLFPSQTKKPVLSGHGSGLEGHASGKLQEVHKPRKWSLLSFKLGSDAQKEQTVEAGEQSRIQTAAGGVLSKESQEHTEAALANAECQSVQIPPHRTGFEAEAPQYMGQLIGKTPSEKESCAGGGDVHQGGDMGKGRRSLLPLLKTGCVKSHAPGTQSSAIEGRGTLQGQRVHGLSTVQLEEGQQAACLVKTATDLAVDLEARRILFEQARLLKLATDPTHQSNTGSSTLSTDGATPTANARVAEPAKPPSAYTGEGRVASPALPGQNGTAVPAAAGTSQQPPAPPAPPPPNPGQVDSGRMSLLSGDGFAPGRGLANGTEDPQMLANFVAGGASPDQPETGFGGMPGAVTRFGSLFDVNAISTLTGGSPYAHNNYGYDQATPGDGSGGAAEAAHYPYETNQPGNGDGAATPTSSASLPTMAQAARTLLNPGPNALEQAGMSVTWRMLKNLVGKPSPGGVFGGLKAPMGLFGRAMPVAGAVLQAHEGATMTPEEARQQYQNKMTGNTEVSLPFGVKVKGDNLAGYLLDNAVNPGRNTRAIVTGIGDARRETQEADAGAFKTDVDRMKMLQNVARDPNGDPNRKAWAEAEIAKLNQERAPSLLDRGLKWLAPGHQNESDRFNAATKRPLVTSSEMRAGMERHSKNVAAGKEIAPRFFAGENLGPDAEEQVKDFVKSVADDWMIKDVKGDVASDALKGRLAELKALRETVAKSPRKDMPIAPSVLSGVIGDTTMLNMIDQAIATVSKRMDPLGGLEMKYGLTPPAGGGLGGFPNLDPSKPLIIGQKPAEPFQFPPPAGGTPDPWGMPAGGRDPFGIPKIDWKKLPKDNSVPADY